MLSPAMASAAVGQDPGHPDDQRGDQDNQPKNDDHTLSFVYSVDLQ
jgi:hypothetical protein